MLAIHPETVDAAGRPIRGATPLRDVADQFYGDRSGQFEDPWGHRWGVATHIEDVSPEELQRRVEEMFLQG